MMTDDSQIESGTDSQPLNYRTVITPGATGPLPRLPNGKMATVNVPPITVHGHSYSRAVIAASTGIHITTVSKYFSGTRTPSVKSALKLAVFFKVSVEELFTRILPRKSIEVVE